MGAMALLKSLMEAATIRRTKKLKQFQTVELRVLMDCEGCERRVKRVLMDCEGCERRVKKSLANMKGVRTLEVDRKQFKVTVTGYVEANMVLKRVRRKTGKKAEMWPYKPYNLVYSPYAAQVYDKKAPAGYVRNPDSSFPTPQRTEEKYTSLFSDDNANACSIM